MARADTKLESAGATCYIQLMLLYCISCLNTKLLSRWLDELLPLAPFSGSLGVREPLSSPAVSELAPGTVEGLQARHQF